MPSSTIQTEDPSAKVDPQDPLPESNWFYRRVFIFLVTIALIGLKVKALDAGQSSTGTDVLLAMAILGYLIAPSAEQATKMLTTVAALRSGVNFHQRSTVDTPSTTATSESAAGKTVDAPSKDQPQIPVRTDGKPIDWHEPVRRAPADEGIPGATGTVASE